MKSIKKVALIAFEYTYNESSEVRHFECPRKVLDAVHEMLAAIFYNLIPQVLLVVLRAHSLLWLHSSCECNYGAFVQLLTLRWLITFLWIQLRRVDLNIPFVDDYIIGKVDSEEVCLI